MTGAISWKQVFDNAQNTFGVGRAANDPLILISVSLFMQEVHRKGLTPQQAAKVLTRSESALILVSQAEAILSEDRQVAIAHTEKLTNLEASSTRIEATLSALNSVAIQLDATSKGIDTRTSEMASKIETHVLTKLDEAVTKSNKAASNTSLWAGLKGAAIATVVMGLPINLGTSYVFDRHWSYDAVMRAKNEQKPNPQNVTVTAKETSKTKVSGAALPSMIVEFGKYKWNCQPVSAPCTAVLYSHGRPITVSDDIKTNLIKIHLDSSVRHRIARRHRVHHLIPG